MLDLPTLHRRACRVLPACLRTSAVMVGGDAEPDPATLAAWLLPLRHVHRGSLWFRLAPQTRRDLQVQPGLFLQEASVAREGHCIRGRPLAYGPWRTLGKVPLVIHAAHSLDGRATLWLSPALGWLIYAWDDRRGRGSGTAWE